MLDKIKSKLLTKLFIDWVNDEFDVELLKIAQSPGEEAMMKIEQFGTGRFIGFIVLSSYLALSPLLAGKGIPGF